MSIIDIFNKDCHLAIRTVVLTLPCFQGINNYIQYLASHPQRPIFYTSNYYDSSNIIRLTWIGNSVEEYTTPNCLE